MMSFLNRYPFTIALLLAVGALAACAAPGSATGTAASTPTHTAETPQSTVTAEATETPVAVETPTTTPSPDAAPLAGSSWILASFATGDEEMLALADATVTLQFEPGGRAAGSGGCNSYGSNYQVEGNSLSFGPIESTLMACLDEAVMDQEQRYLAALESATEFEHSADGAQLRVWYGDGESLLNFVSSAGTPEPAETPDTAEDVDINRIGMFDEGQGWATGRLGGAGQSDQVLVTGDGGGTWQNVTPDDAQSDSTSPGDLVRPDVVASAYFSSPLEAWVAFSRLRPAGESDADDGISAPLVWRTADGGQTWRPGTALAVGDLPYEYFAPSDMDSRDGQFGWLLGHLGAGMSHDYIAIFITEDGGQSWQRVSDPEANPDIQVCNKSGVAFTNRQDGWLAGNCPGLMQPLFLYNTTDGGATWSQTELPTPQGMDVIAGGGLGDRCGIPQLTAVAEDALALSLRCFNFEEESSQTWLYVTGDNGASWQSQPLPEPAGTFEFLDRAQAWYLASNETQPDDGSRIYHTTDGGNTWAVIGQVPGQGQPAINFANAEDGWIAIGYPPDRSLLRSDDGGATWALLEPVAVPR